ncbi:hypothetical protein GCM10027280_02290 [Micromonospora polyrhachis]|uniref:Uncharacterized protein n=1 Tax=Micromonospora polyrhachis TaxID=1282883 RepID=A0A7W7SMI6_9ACTN|nr:hypothetical protein [Micromonospora polyrhachis]MBB4957478.1 hypothetical protein [Micromonospora polyrhachis]
MFRHFAHHEFARHEFARHEFAGHSSRYELPSGFFAERPELAARAGRATGCALRLPTHRRRLA